MERELAACEPLYEYEADLTELTDYGVPLDDVMSGRLAVPPQGMRVDIRFAGDVRGRLPGRIEGVDYLELRADGRMQLDIKATLTTPDGARIALSAGGVALPEPGSTAVRLRENVRLTTACADHAWVNPLEVWAVGEADVGTGRLAVRGYVLE